jgi:hypothetical protein
MAWRLYRSAPVCDFLPDAKTGASLKMRTIAFRLEQTATLQYQQPHRQQKKGNTPKIDLFHILKIN